MSHTNSTANYNLPQFVGTDKPAWLGDINPAMSAIDTAIKTASDNASSASTGTTANTSAIGDLTNLTTTAKTNLVSAINELDSDLGTTSTQVSTNTGNIGNLQTSVNSLGTDLNSFMQKFNLTNITTCNLQVAGTTLSSIKLAQNSDGSIFKLYGMQQVNNTSGSTVSFPNQTLVAGLSGVYGIKTNLQLTTAPDSAYVINGCGLQIQSSTADGSLRRAIVGNDIAVGTDGYIYINVTTSASTLTISGNTALRMQFAPCLYFNASFGDQPE